MTLNYQGNVPDIRPHIEKQALTCQPLQSVRLYDLLYKSVPYCSNKFSTNSRAVMRFQSVSPPMISSPSHISIHICIRLLPDRVAKEALRVNLQTPNSTKWEPNFLVLVKKPVRIVCAAKLHYLVSSDCGINNIGERKGGDCNLMPHVQYSDLSCPCFFGPPSLNTLKNNAR